MSSSSDLAASSACADNQEVYVAMVELEAVSTFVFQGTRWLADVAPHLLPADLASRISQAKKVAELRKAAESEIPGHLLYTKGWPTSLPSASEADLIANVRGRVSQLLNLNANYLTGESVQERYASLIDAKRAREQRPLRSRI
jgi:hypothetical protein